MTLLLALGCGAWLHYEPILYPTAPAPPGVSPRALLLAAVEDGLLLRSAGAPVDVAALPDPVAWVAWVHAGRSFRGGEFDVVHAGWRVEVVRALSGATELQWAPVAPVLPPLPPVAPDCVHGSARWGTSEQDAVGAAFALIDPLVIPWISDVSLWREETSPRRPGIELSWYESRTTPARIQLFDAAFEDEDVGFAGEPSAPVGNATTTILHELGHAFADAPIRIAYNAYLQAFASGGDAIAAWHRYRDVLHVDPVIADFRRVWEEPGPTPYGRRRVHESFAESFYLFYADRPALERVQPAVAAWFARGGPLASVTRLDPSPTGEVTAGD